MKTLMIKSLAFFLMIGFLECESCEHVPEEDPFNCHNLKVEYDAATKAHRELSYEEIEARNQYGEDSPEHRAVVGRKNEAFQKFWNLKEQLEGSGCM